MVSSVRSLGIHGIGGYEVSVECFLSGGLPSFDVVGLPDTAVREARERVRAAVKNCGLKFPVSRITVNLAPADMRKAGTVYDLPVLLSVLSAAGFLGALPRDAAFFGELSLTGELRPVPGALPMALEAERLGIKRLFVPADNAAEASFASGLAVFPVKNAAELIAFLRDDEGITPVRPLEIVPGSVTSPDFSEVKGQSNVKRALEIAAAGAHNILLVGPPGAGKSMMAKRLPSILPDMTRSEIIETSEIYSVMGLTTRDNPVVTRRPFRSPHHTISATAMSGGSANPRPGEISLAHNGVLFLDELPEYHKDVIEVLRQPMEDGQVVVSRAAGSAVFPSRFMLVCAMNPCKCGWFGHPSGRCTCTEQSVRQYQSRISGPMLDRIDMFTEVPALEFDELKKRPEAEPSSAIRERVNAARRIQRMRFSKTGCECNAFMDTKQLAEFCPLDRECEALIRGAYDALGLTGRSYDKILRVARTIADLAGSGEVAPEHLAEAIQYRSYNYTEA